MNRKGFTLIELLVAMVILTVVAMSLGRFVGNFLHAVGTSTVRTIGTAVATEQIELVRARNTTVSYPTLVATFNNANITGFPGYPRMQRTTRVVRTTRNVPQADYTTVTVTVTEPTMGTAINLTVVVAAP
ncbi:MAG: prepilin-type N-terminal cleavage/methylation domain-containing protein [Gemmatimonadota bacterium]|nr:prepilin-type N-terminal cleavage/methylation domain-containing protein [Gemmatimonadota bacterium]